MVKKKRKKKKKKSFPLIWTGIVILLIVTVSLVYLFYTESGRETVKEILPGKKKIKRQRIVDGFDKRIRHFTDKHKIAIVIDDIGYNLWSANELLGMDVPITLSILPHCPYSTEVAERAHRAGREFILHLPMEPSDYPEKNPGEGALLTCMSNNELRHQLEKNLKSVPHASGVNNHMGSRFMADEKKLEVVMKKLKEKNLFFVDSYTTKNTKGQKIAKEIGLKFAGRDVFIDNNSDFTDTLGILKKTIDRRGHWQTLIIIGHPYKSTILAIKETIPQFKAKGIEIVPLSDLTE